ncbi:hypothetical protein PAXRUDRAFT_40339, partial [Paxillus rubicundulus Ve08.2h10]
TSVDIEQLFSCGHLLLSHVCSQLSAQTTHTLLCLGLWSPLNLIKSQDVEKVVSLPDVCREDEVMEDGW